MGHSDRATKYYIKAIQLNPENHIVYINIGNKYINVGSLYDQ